MYKKLMMTILLLTSVIVLCLTLCGCLEHKLTEKEMAVEIINMIERKDETAMRDFFSKEAFDEITEEDFQKGLGYLFSFEPGSVTDMTLRIGNGGKGYGGISYEATYASYDIVTTNGRYFLAFDYMMEYERSYDVEGSFRIVFAEYMDDEAWGGILQRNYYFGIYHPGWENRPESDEIGPYEFLEEKYLFPTDIDKSRWVAQEVDFYFDVDDELREKSNHFNTMGVIRTKEKSSNIVLGIWPNGYTRVDEIIDIKKVIDRISEKEETEYEFESELIEAYLFDSDEDSFKLRIEEEYQYIFGDEPIKEITFVREEMPTDEQSESGESLDISKSE